MTYLEEKSPIFVRGLSRSGGTLLVTLLDSHPLVSMSYELYPTVFDASLSRKYSLELAKALGKGKFKKSLTEKSAPGFTKFILRAERGGINNKKLAELMETHLINHIDFQSEISKYEFIAMCCKHKMYKEEKLYWGSKCTNSYDDYLAIWPNSRFVNIIRDGRDVLASQLNTGDFKNSPSALGKSWVSTHRKFRKLMTHNPEQAFEIKYEALTSNPDKELRLLMEKLKLPFNDRLLNHNSCDLTLFKSHHMSLDAIKKPINESKIGRWKNDLSEQQLNEFISEARDGLIEFGYDV